MSTRHMQLAGHARVFAMTDGAYAKLLEYLKQARLALESEPQAEETIRDLEASIGERLDPFYERPGAVVTGEEMKTLLEGVGPVETATVEPVASSSRQGASWVRVTEGKWLGGVCLGMAARGGFEPAWVRGLSAALILLIAGIIAPLGEGIPMLLFLAAVVLGYLALMLVLPTVKTVRECQRGNGVAKDA